MSAAYTCEQVFGWLGTILWCIQLVPQLWLNYRRKTTEGLAPLLYISWTLSGACLGIFAIVQNISVPIIVQPHCYGSLCAVIFCQMLYYDKKWRWYSACGAFAVYAVVCSGFEVGMVYASKYVEDHHHSDGLTMLWGILSDIFLAVGFLPQYVEIYKAREVYALSYLFLFMDSLGAVFSIMSLAFKDEFDGIAFAGYAVVLIFELVIFLLALILNPRARRLRAELASEPDSHDAPTARPTRAEKGDVEAQPGGGASSRQEDNPPVLPHDEGVGLPVKVESQPRA
ncbi:PQ loop repeat-domain-containing protein [Rhodotorula diobovata]|uniref:PQ loop repeat-domain-containing protein n=1 Tax=Rhodotorula diobovata TaxID=5288 RepID=A0A5C5G477_9BASI|nr:PQ loop repeat-domain-containing protein [Rhodotorula diobovata]